MRGRDPTGDTPSGERSPHHPRDNALVRWLALVLFHWRSILILTSIGTLGMLALSLALPKWYVSEVRMLSPQRSALKPNGLQGLGTHQVEALSSLDMIGALGGGAEPHVLASVLQSRTVTDAVIARFDLRRRYRVSTIEEARKALWSHAGVKVDRKSGVVELWVEDTSPQVARDMAATFAEEANRLNNRLSSSRAGEERRFLEGRLGDAQRDLQRAEVALRDFSVKHKVLDLKEQAKASIQAVAHIRGEILAREVMLSYVSSFAGASDANRSRLMREVAELRRQLTQLENGPGESGAAAAGLKSSSIVIPVPNVPELSLEYVRLYRELKIRETVFELLTIQHELARLAEASDTANAQVIDEPVVATYKWRPKRLYYVVSGFVVSLLLSLALARFHASLAGNDAETQRWRSVLALLRSPAIPEAEAPDSRRTIR